MTFSSAAHLVGTLRPLLVAEAAAEAPTFGLDPADLEQSVWLRLLERLATLGPPPDPERWLRDCIHLEVRRARHLLCRDRPYATKPYPEKPSTAQSYAGEPASHPEGGPERLALRGELRRAVRAAVGRLPGRCARILTAFLSPHDLTYREIAGELGISQGSLGPERSRCLGCLRRMLTAEVAAPGPWGKVRTRQPADR